MYVGELNGRPIATLSAIKYADGHCHYGSFCVEREYRNLGYGMKLVEACIDNSAPIKNMLTYATPDIARKHEETFAMVSHWPVGIYDVNILTALETLKTYNSDGCEVRHMNKVNMQDIYNYDTDIFGYNRVKFLEKWFNTPGAHSRVALNKEGSIVGYVAVRTAFFQEEGYKIGPLFCENIDVGKALLKGVFKDIREYGLSSSSSAVLDSPIGRNPDAIKLMQFVDGKYLGHIELMTSNGLPKGRFDQWFAITSPVCG
jgi:GNAT superfamily N-acetyltransferase